MKILHIITSPAGETSFSTKLGNAVLEKLLVENPGSTVNVRNLAIQPLPHYDVSYLHSLYVPSVNQTPELADIAQISDTVIAELVESDVVVIGVPMYNFGIPSTLKSWVDFVCQPGKTFSYNEKGEVQGLLTNKKVYLAIASGNVYTREELRIHDHTENYLRTVLGWFLGITEITAIRVDGIAIPVLKESALEKSIQSIVV